MTPRLRGTLLRPRTALWVVALVIVLGALLVHQHRSSLLGSLTPNVPAAAPDLGGKLLYTRDGGLWSLTLADGTASELVAAPALGQVTAARWAPDGNQVAYAIYEVRDRRIPVSEVFVASADGSSPRRILGSDQIGTFYQLPVWSSEGQHLYVVHVGQGQRRIARVDLLTGDTQTLADEVGQFDVSPDGRWLALVRSSQTGIGLSLLDLAGGQRRELVPEREFDAISSPRFDPSSRSILFAGAGTVASVPGAEGGLAGLFGVPAAHAHGLPQDLFSVQVEGGRPARLVSLQLDDPAAAWSPDGSHLAVLSYEYLATIRVGSGNPTPVLIPGGLGTVDWSR